MKTSLSKLTVGVMAASLSAGAMAQTDYNEPTRGFMLERGTTAENRKAAVDIGTGSAQDLAAGFRLGLPNAELVLNHDRLRPNSQGDNDNNIGPTQNEALLKFGLQPIALDGGINIDWAAYGALSHYDDDTNRDSVTNFGGGAAFTAEIEDFILNANPELIFDDASTNDGSDLFFNIGLGAHYNLPDTNFGQFQPGIELQLTTRDANDGSSYETRLMLGTRWLYNENVSVDFVMLNQGATGSGRSHQAGGDRDHEGFPGFVRLNVAF